MLSSMKTSLYHAKGALGRAVVPLLPTSFACFASFSTSVQT